MSVTHIAGNRLDIRGRVIQRCSLCGEKLIDNLHEAGPYRADGSISDARATWPVGRLIRVTDGNPSRSVVLDDTDKLPDDSCLDMIE